MATLFLKHVTVDDRVTRLFTRQRVMLETMNVQSDYYNRSLTRFEYAKFAIER